jgi:hypothetical protein
MATRSISPGSQLPRWQRLMLYLIGSGVAISGVLWFVLHQRRDDDIFSPWLTVERTTGIVHGSMSLAMLIVFGSMIPVHVRVGWRSRLNFVSGAALLVALAVLSLSGCALYYLANEQARTATTWLHEIVGALGIVLCLLHRNRRGMAITPDTD